MTSHWPPSLTSVASAQSCITVEKQQQQRQNRERNKKSYLQRGGDSRRKFWLLTAESHRAERGGRRGGERRREGRDTERGVGFTSHPQQDISPHSCPPACLLAVPPSAFCSRWSNAPPHLHQEQRGVQRRGHSTRTPQPPPFIFSLCNFKTSPWWCSLYFNCSRNGRKKKLEQQFSAK